MTNASSSPGAHFHDATFRVARDTPLDRALRERFSGASWTQVRRLIRSGKVFVDGVRASRQDVVVSPDCEVSVHMTAPRVGRDGPSDTARVQLDADAVLHVDTQVVVVDKPAGLSSVPYEDERNTLLHQIERWLSKLERERARRRDSVKRAANTRPRGGAHQATRSGDRAARTLLVVHRLDKATSGILVFARTAAAQRHLKQQFRFHQAQREYLALVHGHIDARTISSRLVKDRGDGLRGSTTNPRLGKPATTHVTPLAHLSRCTLVRCRLETGRTHQIRIHLAEAGHPVLGEKVYGNKTRAGSVSAERLMLHAGLLGFVHPTSGRALRFERKAPADFDGILERERERQR